MKRPRDILPAVVAVLTLPGCIGPDIDTLSQQNEQLREQVLDLEDQIAALKQQNAEIAAQRDAAAADLNRAGGAAPEVVAATPQVAALEIGRLSHRQTDAPALTVYLYPKDGRGRFLQVVGTIELAAILGPDNADPVPIGRARFEADAVHDAYRAGLTGVYYTFDLPLEPPPGGLEPYEHCTLIATFTDMRTGSQQQASRQIRLRP